MNIKRLRKQMGISQSKLAEMARIAQPYLSQLEAGKKTPSIPVAKRIAAALNCEIQVILSDPPTES